MAFISTSQCPRCAKLGNDRKGDNLAEYTNNFYCFRCGYSLTKRNIENALSKPLKTDRVCNGITLEKRLPSEAKKWLLGYGLSEVEMEQFRFAEYNGKNLLILLHSSDYWVGRNFSDGIKYLSSGNKPYVKYGNNPDVLVFVEDVISAIKVGRHFTAIPMLGATVLRDWWQKAASYKTVIIWGDADKISDNVKAARKATEILGKKVNFIYTPKDPKEYNNDYIISIINNY